MSDDFYQRQLRDQQWRQQHEQRQWSDQLWHHDQDALREARQQQSTAQQQLLQPQEKVIQVQLPLAADEAEHNQVASSAGRPTQPLAPQAATSNLLEPGDRSATLDGAPSIGLELLRHPGIGAALPLLAIGVRIGARWLAAHSQARLEQATSCRVCGGTKEMDYNSCIYCGASLK